MIDVENKAQGNKSPPLVFWFFFFLLQAQGILGPPHFQVALTKSALLRAPQGFMGAVI